MKKLLCLSITFLIVLQLSPAWGQTITTVAGTGELYYAPDGIQATDAQVAGPIAFDSKGNYYIANPPAFKVYKVDVSNGVITTVAGTGVRGYSGDGGPATSAQLYIPSGVAVDGSDNLYIACQYRVRKVDASTGVITTVAGTGTEGYSGDGGPATAAEFDSPADVAVDGSGNVFIVDQYNNRVRKVDVSSGVITTVAGTGAAGYSGDGGPATSAQLNRPSGITVDGAGNLYIADQKNNRIRKVDTSTGVITTMAGTGIRGYNGDGLATSVHLNYPSDIVLDGSGNMYIADYSNSRVRKVDISSGMTATVAGTGTDGYSGDGGPAISAELNYPTGVALDGSDNLYIVDYENQRIRKVEVSTGVINTVAGIGSNGYGGDGGAATSAQLNSPTSVEVGVSGDLYIVDKRNFCIRKVDASTGVITTVAGNGTAGYSGDGGPATSAQLLWPSDVALDDSGNLYIADRNNSRIRKVNVSTGVITTVAGTGTMGHSGDGGLATEAQFNAPSGVAIDGSGNLYIADLNSVRKVDASTGVITTIAGTGTAGYSGDDGPATSAQLYDPNDIATDGLGNLYIADRVNHRIRKVDLSTGVITTVAGTGIRGYGGDGGPATSAQLFFPIDVAVDDSGNLYIADLYNNRIRKVNASTGVITTFAGTGSSGYSGDGGPATSAQLHFPIGVALDGLGNLYIADRENQRIRKITDATAPSLTISSPEGDPTNASPIPLTFKFDENVSGFTVSDITVTNGSISNFAGASKNYTADLNPSADGIVTVDVNTNVATDAAGNGNTSATPFHISFDTSVPTVNSVTVPANATYMTGQVLEFTVNFSENVTVTTTGGAPKLSLTIGDLTRMAGYASGSGSAALVFRHTVQAGDEDEDGIIINSLDANGGIVEDYAGNHADLILNAVESAASVFVNVQVIAGVEADTPADDGEAKTPVIYTGFTPDGDGVNDAWEIDNATAYPHMTVRIFNRDGQELFRSAEGYRQPWDGTYNGRQLPFGTYYYVIRLNDRRDRTLKGTVMILK